MATNALSANSVDWGRQAKEDAKQDSSTIIFDGQAPNQLACDTTVRPMPDGSWVTVMLGGGHTEPLPANRVFISRSRDQGKTWTPMCPIDLGIKSKDPTRAITLSELMLNGERATMVLQVHNGGFSEWKTYFVHSDDSCHTWSELEPAPGKLADRTMIRNAIRTRDGRILMPFQHYNRCDETGHKISKGRVLYTPRDPRIGVIESVDGGRTWDLHGDIRLTDDNNYHGWAEPNIVELSDGTIAMIIRADRLGGVLYYAESKDGGRSWPEFAAKTTIPNPGSKATLYGLGGDTVAILHNPNPRHRSPLALWISFDGLKTWPYRRVLVPESCDTGGRINYPDGFVGEDGKFLNLAFDDNRHRCVFYRAKLPPLPSPIGVRSIRKILFLGNSITRHGPKKSIGWSGDWGMAASAQEKDFVHLVTNSLSKTSGTAPKVMIKNIAEFERQYTSYDVDDNLKEAFQFGADLVIVAIGENVPQLNSEESKDQFADSFRRLLRGLKADNRPALVVRSCFWPNEAKDQILEQACQEVGGIFVDIGQFEKDEANYARSEREFTHDGVAAHPGDKGMQAIADAVLGAINRLGQVAGGTTR